MRRMWLGREVVVAGPPHTELTTERSILFLLFEIKRAFVYISTIFKLTDLIILYFFI